MRKRSAGILMFRIRDGGLQVLLVHPGGPFWARKDAGSWSIPKGEYDEDEDPSAAAVREFEEETGQNPLGPEGAVTKLIELGEIQQRGGKTVSAWAVEGEFEIEGLRSNTFALEWPRGSGVHQEYPEVDRAGWFDPAQASGKLVSAQGELVDRLVDFLRLTGRLDAP